MPLESFASDTGTDGYSIQFKCVGSVATDAHSVVNTVNTPVRFVLGRLGTSAHADGLLAGIGAAEVAAHGDTHRGGGVGTEVPPDVVEELAALWQVREQ